MQKFQQDGCERMAQGSTKIVVKEWFNKDGCERMVQQRWQYEITDNSAIQTIKEKQRRQWLR